MALTPIKFKFTNQEISWLSISCKYCIRYENDPPMTKEQKDFLRLQIKENNVKNKDLIICLEMMMGESPKGITQDHKDVITIYENWYQGMRESKLLQIADQEEEVRLANNDLKAVIRRNDPRGKGKLVLGKKPTKKVAKKK